MGDTSVCCKVSHQMSIPVLFLNMGLELSLGPWQIGRHSVTNLIALLVFLIFKIQGSVFRTSLTQNSLHSDWVWAQGLHASASKASGATCLGHQTCMLQGSSAFFSVSLNIFNSSCTVLLSLGPLSLPLCSHSSVCMSTLREVLGGVSDKRSMLEETSCLLPYSHLLNSTVWKLNAKEKGMQRSAN